MISSKKQNLLILLCWLMYVSAYFGRYSFSSNITQIMADFGTDHAATGLVTTCFFFAYGAGQVINGCFCKRYPKRTLFLIATVCSSVFNLLLYVGVPFGTFKYIWLVNGFVQSVFWTLLVHILSCYLDDAHLTRAILIISTTTTAGTLLTYALSSLLSAIGQYRLSFFIAAIIMTGCGILWFFLYPYLTRGATIRQRSADIPQKGEGARTQNLRLFLLFAPIVVLGFMAVLDNLIKDGLQTWVPTILKESFGMTDAQSILLSLILPIFGIFGATVSTLLQKKIRNYILLCALLFGASTVSIAWIMLFIRTQVVGTLIGFGLVVLLMHAVNNVVTSMVPLYMRDQIDSGKLAGILNGACYVGSTIASYGLGMIADTSGGWNAVFLFLLCSSAFAVLIGLIFASFVRRLKTDASKASTVG